jgi:UDP:flavonoid glycosyltransferase YjiC (YdhE family)
VNLTIVANDTRGGVEPYLALAAEAVVRGHEVRVAAPADYAEECRRRGIRFAALAGVDPAAIGARAGRTSFREMSRHVEDFVPVWATTVRDLAVGSDLIISGLGGMGLARPAATALGIPLLRAHLQPLEAPSAAYPGPLASQLDGLGPVGRRLSHAVTELGTGALMKGPERAARAAIGATGEASTLPSILYGFSSAVVPVASDTRTERIATGYWTLAHEEGDDVPEELEEFLGTSSSPVVSIGFGSMVGHDAERLFDTVLTAVRRAGVRAVVLSGWGGLAGTASDADVRVVSSVPHGWLFPRVAATVHHGGAGTTGAALAAAVPTFVVPFIADQYFWGRRAEKLGVAPAPVPNARLTADRLTAALERMLRDADLRARASALGAELQRENGTARALDHIESIAETGG